MPRKLFSLLIAALIVQSTAAQLCPGGGTSFYSSVLFDQSWVYSCSTGTSCNGGISFDNRIACQPTTAMDACAPAPSCTSARNGSNIWFKFYAFGTTATIHVIQNASFIVGVQAFKGSVCGALTEIGCVVATGPSSGATLNLSGLNSGSMYYFRIYGSSNNASQRTGTYCFCGSTSLGTTPLPVTITSFTGEQIDNRYVSLKWVMAGQTEDDYFTVEHSTDGVNFYPLQQIAAKEEDLLTTYQYQDNYAPYGANFYRLKITEKDGSSSYSKMLEFDIKNLPAVSIYPNPSKNKVTISCTQKMSAVISNSYGLRIKMLDLQSGKNEINTADLQPGIYYLKTDGTANVVSFLIN